MSPLIISSVAFVCIFGATLLGMFLRTILPEHHLSDESKDAVKVGIGMIATLAALILGLLTASAKGTFDTASTGLRQIGARTILLDRVMAHYGPETKETRALLRGNVAAALEQIWPEEKIGLTMSKRGEGETVPDKLQKQPARIETIQDNLRQLTPQTDAQRWLQSRAMQVSGDIAEGRWLLIEQMGQSSFPKPFIVILVFWLSIIFATFGLFSPRNATVIVVLLVCSLSVAGSLLLIMELDSPYGGLIKVSSAPLRHALTLLGG
ncbi:MAG: hypothetical protein M1438_00095 [Deltaproteobacteria bacterium]|nr:hypothetical protein [Deltaproteobacteria bacterium]